MKNMRRRDVRITGAALFFAASVLGNSFGFVEAVGGQDSENEITQYEGYELVWNDEFDGEYLDDTKWRIGNTPENGSHKYNTAKTEEGKLENENVFLENGALQLKATPLAEPETVKSYKRTVKSKKMVRFRVRAYRKAGKVKIYGKYSAVKKVKLKK